MTHDGQRWLRSGEGANGCCSVAETARRGSCAMRYGLSEEGGPLRDTLGR